MNLSLLLAILLMGPALPFLLAILVHELGHLLAAMALSCPLNRLRWGSMGLEMDFLRCDLGYGRELVLLVSGSLLGLCSMIFIPDESYRICALCLNFANLLPLRGLDGGGIFDCLCHLCLPGDTADRICHMVSLLTAMGMWLCGMWIVLRVGTNLTWMLCGMGAVLYELKK